MKKSIILILNLFLLIFIVTVDQLTKILSQKYLIYNTKNIIDNILSLTYVENKGVAFGILSGRNLFIIILTSLIALITIRLFLNALNLKKYNFCFLSNMIFAGFLGNFIDRIRFGFVIDFLSLDFINFPIFNIADIFVTIPTFIIMIYILKLEDNEIYSLFSLKGGNNDKRKKKI